MALCRAGLLVSRAAWDQAELGPPPAEREVEVAGRAGNLAVVSTGPSVEVAATSGVGG